MSSLELAVATLRSLPEAFQDWSSIDQGMPSFDEPGEAALARDLGITRAALSGHAARFSREFGLTNRGQVHGWNRRPAAPPSHRD